MLVHCEGVWFLNIYLFLIYTFLKDVVDRCRGVFKIIPSPIQLMQPGNMESMTHPQLLGTPFSQSDMQSLNDLGSVLLYFLSIKC